MTLRRFDLWLHQREGLCHCLEWVLGTLWRGGLLCFGGLCWGQQAGYEHDDENENDSISLRVALYQDSH